MMTAFLLLGLALLDGGPEGAPKEPPGMDQVEHGRVWAYFNVNARDGFLVGISIWEKLADENGKLGEPECLLDVQTRIGLGRGVFVKGTGTFSDPILIAPPNRGLGSRTCLRISPRLARSKLLEEF